MRIAMIKTRVKERTRVISCKFSQFQKFMVMVIDSPNREISGRIGRQAVA